MIHRNLNLSDTRLLLRRWTTFVIISGSLIPQAVQRTSRCGFSWISGLYRPISFFPISWKRRVRVLFLGVSLISVGVYWVICITVCCYGLPSNPLTLSSRFLCLRILVVSSSERRIIIFDCASRFRSRRQACSSGVCRRVVSGALLVFHRRLFILFYSNTDGIHTHAIAETTVIPLVCLTVTVHQQFNNFNIMHTRGDRIVGATGCAEDCLVYTFQANEHQSDHSEQWRFATHLAVKFMGRKCMGEWFYQWRTAQIYGDPQWRLFWCFTHWKLV